MYTIKSFIKFFESQREATASKFYNADKKTGNIYYGNFDMKKIFKELNMNAMDLNSSASVEIDTQVLYDLNKDTMCYFIYFRNEEDRDKFIQVFKKYNPINDISKFTDSDKYYKTFRFYTFGLLLKPVNDPNI